MASPTRFPARALSVGGPPAIVKLRPEEEQGPTMRKARVAIAAQMARAANAAPSERARREIERRVIVVEPRGKRSIAIRRLENRSASRKKAAPEVA